MMTQGLPAHDFAERFVEFSGTRLEWEVLCPNFMGLYLGVFKQSSLIGRLQFLYPRYFDGPTVMNDVQLRMATAIEIDQLRAQMQNRQAVEQYFSSALIRPERTLLAIDAAEGTFFIWAAGMRILCVGEEAQERPESFIWWPDPPFP